jgi:1-phosphofructokinase
MVITVTLNPAMDKTLTVDGFSLGEVNRVISARNDIGGKCVNVSKVLKEFSIESAAIGFLGGAEEEVFRSELKEIEG